MYICICRSVTDRDIRQALCEGACGMRDLRERLGVCSQCGKCARSVRELVDESRGDGTDFATLEPA